MLRQQMGTLKERLSEAEPAADLTRVGAAPALSAASPQPAILVVCVVLWGCLQSEDGFWRDCKGPGETAPHDCMQVDSCSAWDSWAVETCGQRHFTSQWEETLARASVDGSEDGASLGSGWQSQ